MRPIRYTTRIRASPPRVVALMDQCELPTVIARILGVARGFLSRWKTQAQQPDGLTARPHLGPATCLNGEQESRLVELLQQGATAHGRSNELWAATRVIEVIQYHFCLSYHPEYVRKIVKQCLGWTSQKIQQGTCRKLYLGVNEATGEIVPESLTENSIDDASQVTPLLEQIDAEVVGWAAMGVMTNTRSSRRWPIRRTQDRSNRSLPCAEAPRLNSTATVKQPRDEILCAIRQQGAQILETAEGLSPLLVG